MKSSRRELLKIGALAGIGALLPLRMQGVEQWQNVHGECRNGVEALRDLFTEGFVEDEEVAPLWRS